MSTTDRAREARVRRLAQRNGLVLVKSRTRTPERHDFGTYGIIDPARNAWVYYSFGLGRGFGLSLDEAEDWLAE